MDEIEKDNVFNLYQVYKSILFLKIECDVVVSPLNYTDTIDWYRKQLGYDPDDDLEVNIVNINEDGLYYPIPEDDEDYETMEYLRYIDGFIELIRYSTSNKIGNIRFIDGEPCKFITFKQYADILLKDTLKQPEIIASTEI